MNKSIIEIQNPFTHKIVRIKRTVNEMQSAKFYAVLLVSVILVGTFSLSAPVNVILRTTGRISAYGTANSGSAEDIQAAVDEAYARGISDVYIPEGVFNFVEVGEPWMTVTIPAGINLFGAPTERTSGEPEPTYGMNPNNQVVEWKTVLVMPYDAPYGSIWFNIVGTGDPNKPTRFSDIKLSGYRDIDPTATEGHRAILITDAVDFRIDHCFFSHTTGGIWVGGVANGVSRGVIDHNRFVNEYGVVSALVAQCTVFYGVGMGRMYTSDWEPNIDNILGKYLNYTVFIEDNYFSRWRHCTASNHGQHYVFRHNTIKNSGGFGDIDAHGVYEIVGTRAMEIYNNEIIDPVDCSTYDSTWPENPQPYARAVFWRGGGGVMFNNYIRNYLYIIEFAAEDWSGVAPYCFPHDIWIWDNTYEGVGPTPYTNPVPPVVEGEDYFLYEKPGYVPYPFPHHLTLESYP